MPVTTARRRLFGAEKTVNDNLRRILVEVASADEMGDTQAEIENLLRQRRRVRAGALDDFHVRNMAEFIRTRTETQSILSLLLGATAAISLIVGGIGIMNIMLVSVTERTKEIGLRMAVGARRRDILTQFLIEAVTLCLTGGLIGLLIGGGAAIALAIWGSWPIALSPGLVVIALAAAALVGVFFGFYPARRASLMNPIDALRYECGSASRAGSSRSPLPLRERVSTADCASGLARIAGGKIRAFFDAASRLPPAAARQMAHLPSTCFGKLAGLEGCRFTLRPFEGPLGGRLRMTNFRALDLALEALRTAFASMTA